MRRSEYVEYWVWTRESQDAETSHNIKVDKS